MTVYHDEIEIEDFEYDEETETYHYPCPCGDRFEITKVSLKFCTVMTAEQAETKITILLFLYSSGTVTCNIDTFNRHSQK